MLLTLRPSEAREQSGKPTAHMGCASVTLGRRVMLRGEAREQRARGGAADLDARPSVRPSNPSSSAVKFRGCGHPRSAIISLVFAIACAGLSCFGQVRVQFMMVWQR
jgi:hypothetical protein